MSIFKRRSSDEKDERSDSKNLRKPIFNAIFNTGTAILIGLSSIDSLHQNQSQVGWFGQFKKHSSKPDFKGLALFNLLNFEEAFYEPQYKGRPICTFKGRNTVMIFIGFIG